MKKKYNLTKWPKTYLVKRQPNQEIKHLFTISSIINYDETINFKKNDVKKKKIPVKGFVYKLDYFQKISIKCIIRKENTIVAAHTSSGKTVIAEYTIANAINQRKKIIYTSPIKALSNQKFRDFSNLFYNGVGLITGDISINSSADCIVMTTEILRSMLYENILITNELQCVILDETHYINDRERGFIWEEILILLPKNIKIVCLSATIPNTREFAEWIVDIKNTSINIIQTSKRPVILEHYIFPYFSPGLYLVTDKNGSFVPKKYNEVFNKNNLKKKKDPSKYTIREKIKKIIEKIFKIGYWPIIIFSFGKKQCFQLLYKLKKKKFCEINETKIIRLFFTKCFSILSKKIVTFLRLNYIFYFFKRGLGIHHSGVLPLIREITEILFQATLIKVLCATETFSIGLNMPAKAVVFSSLAKFDGQNLRILNKSEFIQMSGRAGRRGLDNKGIVITVIDSFTDPKKIEGIIRGKTEPVISMFHINLNTILNNIRNKKTNDVSLISNSFFAYQNFLFAIKKKKILNQLETRNLQLISPFDLTSNYLCKIWNLYEIIKNYLKKLSNFDLIVNRIFENKLNLNDQNRKFFFFKSILSKFQIIIFLIFSFSQSLNLKTNFNLTSNNHSGKNINVKNLLFIIIWITKDLKCDIMEIYGKHTKCIQTISILLLKLSIYGCSLFYIQHMKKKIQGQTFLLLIKKIKFRLIKNIKCVYINSKNKFSFKKEFKRLNNVLKLLRIIDFSDILTIKGLACSDLNFEDDLLLIELIFSGELNNVPTERLTSLIGIFFSQNFSFKTKPHPDLKEEIKCFQKILKKMQKICKNSLISINIAKYIGKINLTIPNTIYGLCQGINFLEINQTNILIESTIGKDIKRLNNLLIQLSRVSEKLGDVNLSIKFDNCSSKLEKSSALIKSLYF
nr:RNA helicase ATP-dependent, SK12/DOB1 protein [Cryptomonas curvata]